MAKAYMICDGSDEIAASIQDAPNIGVEYMGNCFGRLISESGEVLGSHYSSSFGWLRRDLASKVKPGEYEIVDLIGKPIPEDLVAMIAEDKKAGEA